MKAAEKNIGSAKRDRFRAFCERKDNKKRIFAMEFSDASRYVV